MAELTGRLNPLGIDEEAIRIYHATLDLGNCTRDELALRLGLPLDRVDTALAVLADSVLVRSFPGDGPGAAPGEEIRPVSPEAGLTAALARRRERIPRAQAEIERLEADVAELISAHESLAGRGAGVEMERVRGAGAVAVRVLEFTTAAEESICVLAPDRSAGIVAGLTENEAGAALSRGLTLRRLHLSSIRNRPEQCAAAGRIAAAGAQVRTAPVLPLEMMIFDGRAAILPHDPADLGAGAVVIHHRGTVAGLCALFEGYWAGSEKLGFEHEVDDRGLTSTERELLRQLADGSTDATVARRMGVSLRTVRRISAQLMTRLGARSRFQAGVRAATAEWL